MPWLFMLLLAAGFVVPSRAETSELPSGIADTNATPEPASFLSSLANTNHWNAWHARWSSNITSTARYIDGFFADPKLDEESNGTRIKLSLGARFKEYEDTKLINKINLRLQLPGASKRLQLVFEDLVESDQPGTASAVVNDFNNSRPDAALRYNLRKKKQFKLDADAGARLGGTDQVFLRLRGDRKFEITDHLRLRLTQSVRWWSVDGWVSLSQLEIDQQLHPDLLFRSKSELEWPEEEPGVTPMQTFSLIYAKSSHRAYRIDVGGIWPESPEVSETRYFVNLTSRRRIHSDWLYLELKPGVEFAQERNYEEAFFFQIQFDVVFGKVE